LYAAGPSAYKIEIKMVLGSVPTITSKPLKKTHLKAAVEPIHETSPI
jgi:hypothetical protein